jgi:hypothetical protein
MHVEGQTEETFVNEVLRPHLCAVGYTNVSARLLGNARQRDHRGGICSWAAVRKDIANHLKHDRACLATTIVDFYGLPKSGQNQWPGRDIASSAPFADRPVLVENALAADIAEAIGETSPPKRRFVPFVVMHEFEGLLFSDCTRFAEGIGRSDLAADFQRIRNQFASPEEINDSPETAPSKRVERLVPGYQKPLHGVLAAIEIGLDAIRTACPHRDGWLHRLETWPASMTSPPTTQSPNLPTS